jgi:fatty acid desaturase
MTPETRPLDDATLRQLYRPVPGAVRRAILITFAGLAATFTIALGTGSGLGYAIAFVLAVAVQTRAAILMHEGAHWLLHPDKRVNDRLANWAAAYPIGLTVETYRRNHLRHHTDLGTPRDPDFVELCLPPLSTGLGTSLVRCVTGHRHLQLLRKYTQRDADARDVEASGGLASITGRAVWQLGLLGVATAAGQPLAYVVVWLLPLLTTGVVVNELRSIVEHTPLLDPAIDVHAQPLVPLTRTVRTGWAGRLWFAPLHFNYHHEHHLLPGVPFSRLPELHDALAERGYYATRSGLLWDGYPAIIGALWRRCRDRRCRVRLEDGAFVAHGA